MKIAGLDIGTTGCKLTVFDESGEYLGKAYREYAVRRDMSRHEIDAAAVMDSVYAVIREMFYGDTQYYVPFEESPPLPGEVREGLDVEDTDIEEETLNP